MTVDPLVGPGRCFYEQVRALRRAKRRHLLRKVTVVEPGKVLQFRPRETPPDKEAS